MKKDTFLLIILALMVFQLPAQAYLDPGTGSLVLQVVLAGLAGAACWIKIQWKNIKEFFKNLWTKKQ